MSSLAFALALIVSSQPTPQTYFKIHVVDDSTGRGVPLAQLQTVSKQRFTTDSNGFIAFDEPGLMGKKVFFNIESPGYEYPKDGFGYRGVALSTQAGSSATIKLKRLNVAERLCRLTGQGIYRDSELLGEPVPIEKAVIDGDVTGQDTAQAELYKGKMLWFWGDTDRLSYPLGNFHGTGAYATFPKDQSGADAGLEFHYFPGQDGFVRPMVKSDRPHPIWLSGLVQFDQKLYAFYAEAAPRFRVLNCGYLCWNDSTERFDYAKKFDSREAWRYLEGHLLRDHGYVLGQFPPTVRASDSLSAYLDNSTYEGYTCQDEKGGVMRGPDGKAFYRWQKELPPIKQSTEQILIRKGLLKPDEAHFLPRDEQGETIVPHNGSVHWNAYRKKWIAIFTRVGAPESYLGEIYYSEADAPIGPFRRAVKVASHPNYTFYNPVQHEFLDRDDGRIIYFEGTYTQEFSNNPTPTPLYNYNQLLYRLDLADPRLAFAEK